MSRGQRAPTAAARPSDADRHHHRRPGPVQRWLHRLAANVTYAARQHDLDIAVERAIRAFHAERSARAQRSGDDDAWAGWWTGPPPYGYWRITRRMRDHHGTELSMTDWVWSIGASHPAP